MAYVRPNENSFPILTKNLGFAEVRQFDSRRFALPSGRLSKSTGLPVGFWRSVGADSIMQRLALGGRRSTDVRVEPCANFSGADSLWESARAGYQFSLVHDQAYFDWRYAACPTPYRIYRASRAGAPSGWVVTFANRGEPLGFIADLFAARGDKETVDALLAACVPDLLQSGCKYVYAWTLKTSGECASHEALGRVCRFYDPERLYIAARGLAPGWSAARLPEDGWYLSMGGFDGI
jgi:hypothetical protein